MAGGFGKRTPAFFLRARAFRDRCIAGCYNVTYNVTGMKHRERRLEVPARPTTNCPTASRTSICPRRCSQLCWRAGKSSNRAERFRKNALTVVSHQALPGLHGRISVELDA